MNTRVSINKSRSELLKADIWKLHVYSSITDQIISRIEKINETKRDVKNF